MSFPVVGSEMLRRFADGFRGSTFDTCYRWAQHRIVMPPEDGRPAAPYSDERYPWVKEILNSRAPYNWVMKGAQVGLTVCGMVRAWYEVDYHGNDTLYLLPTDKAALLFSKTRLNPLIKLSPYLSSRVDDAMDVKQIGIKSLYIRGANGDINIKSTPVSRLVLDEIDEMSDRQVMLALERLSGKEDKIVWGMSTPTYPSQGIHKYYLRSTQEHYFFDCPHCGKEIELTYPDSLEIKGVSVEDPECAMSRLRCTLCDGTLLHADKPKWLRNGRWKPTAIDADPGHRGFHLPQLYSPTIRPTDLAISYHAGVGDEAARRVFHNDKLGEPYVEDGAQVNDAHIDACVKPYRTFEGMPVGCKDVITLGIDQGGSNSFHHWVAVKWTFGDNPNITDVSEKAHGRVIGFGRILSDNWETDLYPLMRRWQAKMCVIDAQPDPSNPRRFARHFRGYVWLCYYVVGRGAREITPFEDESGANVCKVDKTSWLSVALGRVMSGRIDFPADITYDFRRQLKNQIRTFKQDVDGNYKAEYLKLADDHYGHALCYAELALKLLDPATHAQPDIISSIRG